MKLGILRVLLSSEAMRLGAQVDCLPLMFTPWIAVCDGDATGWDFRRLRCKIRYVQSV